MPKNKDIFKDVFSVMDRFYHKDTGKYTHLIFELSKKDIDFNNSLYGENLKRLRNLEPLISEYENKLKKGKITKEYFIAHTIFLPFSEISKSFQSLVNIKEYLVLSIPKKSFSKVTKGEYIRYNIENYLNEIYILHQRMTNYTGLIKNSYKNTQITSRIEKLNKRVEYSFKSVKNLRGEHIHRNRFTDERLDLISFYELMLKIPDEKSGIIQLQLNMTYKETIKYWRDVFDESLESILLLTDSYFGELLNILQDPNNMNDIVYPNYIK